MFSMERCDWKLTNVGNEEIGKSSGAYLIERREEKEKKQLRNDPPPSKNKIKLHKIPFFR